MTWEAFALYGTPAVSIIDEVIELLKRRGFLEYTFVPQRNDFMAFRVYEKQEPPMIVVHGHTGLVLRGRPELIGRPHVEVLTFISPIKDSLTELYREVRNILLARNANEYDQRALLKPIKEAPINYKYHIFIEHLKRDGYEIVDDINHYLKKE